VSSADVPEESSRRSVQQLENSVGRAQFWCEKPACRGVQQNGGVTDSLEAYIIAVGFSLSET